MAENDDEEEGYGPGNRRYWEDRWRILDELTPEEQANPITLRLRLECAIELQKWDTVQTLATSLSDGPERDDRSLAARGLLALAREASTSGDMIVAFDHIRLAIDVWPEAREEASEDPELSMYLPR